MRYIVFSDIHGNNLALKLMMEQTIHEKIDGYIFCGDIVGYFYEQEDVINQLRKWNERLYAVLGNHDFNYLNGLSDERYAKMFSRQYGRSYVEKLSVSALTFLQRLSHSLSLIIDGKSVLVIHGNLSNPLDGRIYPDTEIEKKELYSKYDVVFTGHTHYQMKRKCDKTLLINPGSLGQPRDGKGFSYCIFDFEKMKAEFYTIEIDVKALVDNMLRRKENMSLVAYMEIAFERNKYGACDSNNLSGR